MIGAANGEHTSKHISIFNSEPHHARVDDVGDVVKSGRGHLR